MTNLIEQARKLKEEGKGKLDEARKLYLEEMKIFEDLAYGADRGMFSFSGYPKSVKDLMYCADLARKVDMHELCSQYQTKAIQEFERLGDWRRAKELAISLGLEDNVKRYDEILKAIRKV